MEALNPATPYTPKSAIPSPQSPSPSPLAASSSRLWRPTAQRKLRNQWSKLPSLRQEWASSSSTGRLNAMSLNAMSLVNAYLSMKYLASMELGVLSDMPDIRKKVSQKLLKQQVVSKLLLGVISLLITVV